MSLLPVAALGSAVPVDASICLSFTGLNLALSVSQVTHGVIEEQLDIQQKCRKHRDAKTQTLQEEKAARRSALRVTAQT